MTHQYAAFTFSSSLLWYCTTVAFFWSLAQTSHDVMGAETSQSAPVDFERCSSALTQADLNDDRIIIRSEYTTFLDIYLGEDCSDEDFILVFYSTACSCTGPDCCVGDNAQLDISRSSAPIILCTLLERAIDASLCNIPSTGTAMPFGAPNTLQTPSDGSAPALEPTTISIPPSAAPTARPTQQIADRLWNTTYTVVVWAPNPRPSNWLVQELTTSMDRLATLIAYDIFGGSPSVQLPTFLDDMFQVECPEDYKIDIANLRTTANGTELGVNGKIASCEKVSVSMILLGISRSELKVFAKTMDAAILQGLLVDTLLDDYPGYSTSLFDIIGHLPKDQVPSTSISPSPTSSPIIDIIPKRRDNGKKGKRKTLSLGWRVAFAVIGCLAFVGILLLLFLKFCREDKFMNLQHTELKSEHSDSEQESISERGTGFETDVTNDQSTKAETSDKKDGSCAQISFTYPSQGITTLEMVDAYPMTNTFQLPSDYPPIAQFPHQVPHGFQAYPPGGGFYAGYPQYPYPHVVAATMPTGQCGIPTQFSDVSTGSESITPDGMVGTNVAEQVHVFEDCRDEELHSASTPSIPKQPPPYYPTFAAIPQFNPASPLGCMTRDIDSRSSPVSYDGVDYSEGPPASQLSPMHTEYPATDYCYYQHNPQPPPPPIYDGVDYSDGELARSELWASQPLSPLSPLSPVPPPGNTEIRAQEENLFHPIDTTSPRSQQRDYACDGEKTWQHEQNAQCNDGDAEDFRTDSHGIMTNGGMGIHTKIATSPNNSSQESHRSGYQPPFSPFQPDPQPIHTLYASPPGSEFPSGLSDYSERMQMLDWHLRNRQDSLRTLEEESHTSHSDRMTSTSHSDRMIN